MCHRIVGCLRRWIVRLIVDGSRCNRHPILVIRGGRKLMGARGR